MYGCAILKTKKRSKDAEIQILSKRDLMKLKCLCEYLDLFTLYSLPYTRASGGGAPPLSVLDTTNHNM